MDNGVSRRRSSVSVRLGAVMVGAAVLTAVAVAPATAATPSPSRQWIQFSTRWISNSPTARQVRSIKVTGAQGSECRTFTHSNYFDKLVKEETFALRVGADYKVSAYASRNCTGIPKSGSINEGQALYWSVSLDGAPAKTG